MDLTLNLTAVSILIDARRALSALHPAQNLLRVALWSVIDDLTGAELDAALFLVRVDYSRVRRGLTEYPSLNLPSEVLA